MSSELSTAVCSNALTKHHAMTLPFSDLESQLANKRDTNQVPSGPNGPSGDYSDDSPAESNDPASSPLHSRGVFLLALCRPLRVRNVVDRTSVRVFL